VLWSGTVQSVYLKGGTGAWAAVTNAPETNGWSATATSAHTFTIPVNATAFGSFSGQRLTFFMAGGEAASFTLGYGYEGSNWYDALLQLSLAYKVTGNTAYASKALQLVDFMNTLGKAGMISPISQDGGRADMAVTLGLAIAYDWLYSNMTAAQRTATYTTLNLWNNWTVGNAYSISDPTSNYWEAHQTAVAATGYATYGENPTAQSWIDWANANWNAHFARMFDAPSTTVAAQTNAGQGMFFGGQTVIGHNYGGNDISRHLKYMWMVKTATGTDIFSTTDYAQRWANALVYELKPDRWHAVSWGRWPGDYYGVMNLSEPLLLSHVLEGTTQGAWAQWLYTNMDTRNAPAYEQTVRSATLQDRLMFYKASRPAVDYRTTEPPYRFVDGSDATLIWRSDWSDAANYVDFRLSTADAAVGDIPKDAGHIDVTRGSDYLLVQSNMWKGVGDGSTGNPQLDYYHSAKANTLYFWDGGSKGGGRCFDQSVSYDGCQTGFGVYKPPVQKISALFAFGQNEFASSYDYAQVPSARTLTYFFRTFVAFQNGAYVVWDRIQSTSASHTKQLRWQLSAASTPTVNGAIVTSTVGSSRLFVDTMLPASPKVQLVRNVDESNNPANWHVEVSDSAPATSLNALTVLYAGASTSSMPSATRLTTIDANFEGLQILDTVPKIAVLPKGVTPNSDGTFASTTYTSTRFSTTHAGTGTYVVAGLAPGTYAVLRNGAPVDGVNGSTVDDSGTLSFSAPAGAFSVTQTSGAAGTSGGTTSDPGSGTGSTVTGSGALSSGTSTSTGSSTSSSGSGTPTPPSGNGWYTCSGGQFVMASDITLTSSLSADLIGTPSAHCVVQGNGHRFIVSDSSWTGHITISYADVTNLGTATLSAIGGASSGNYAYVNGGYIDIENSTFHRSGGFNFYTAGSSAVTFSRNVYASDNLVSAKGDDPFAQPFFTENGASTAVKRFQGNRILRSWVNVGSPNWIIGAAPGCTTTCDADGNLMVGRRVGIGVAGQGSYVAYNYTHNTLDVTPAEPSWSQVYNIHNIGRGVVVENNVLHTGDWIVNGIDGDLRNNVLSELSPHNFARIGNGGLVHHNILLTLYPGLDRFDSTARFLSGDAAFALAQAGNTLSLFNNTLDLRGSAVKSALSVNDGATVTSFRNNVVYRLTLLATYCPTSANCTSAIGLTDGEGFISPPPVRAQYLDYNDFFYDPSTQRQVTYDVAVSGKTQCQGGWGGHDLGGCPNASLDPRFRGPLPIGTGQTGTGSPNDSGFPFNDGDILSGEYTVSQMLAYFRWVYAPAAGSPLLGAQDPADGPGDVGAVQNATLPPSAPPIVTTNKRPMVYAGPSYQVSGITDVVKLSGYAADDGLPSNTLTLQWSVVRGPGTVTFASPTAGITTASFSANGLYVVQLAASDGQLTSTSEAAIAVGVSLNVPSNLRIVK
jgi:hypothetical protein